MHHKQLVSKFENNFIAIVNGCIGLPELLQKSPQTGWFKNQKFIFSHFWRLAFQDQGISEVNRPFEVSLPDLQVGIFSVFIWPSPFVCLCPYIKFSLSLRY